MINHIKTAFWLAVLLLFINSCSRSGKATAELKVGVLPVIQALPVFVASDQGLFDKYGIGVDIINFNSALETEVAINAGQIDGYFGDLVTPMILAGHGTGLQVVTTLFNTTTSERMFGLLIPPGADFNDLPDLAETGIAVSKNTVIDFITGHLLARQSPSITTYNQIDTKNMAIRMQLLLNGQVSAAVLPEPLVTFAEQTGARVILDDSGSGMTPTVMSFRTAVLKQRKNTVQQFLLALRDAIELINTEPELVRPIMNTYCRIPDAIRGSFPIPQFPGLAVPTQELTTEIQDWLIQNEIITTRLSYEQIISSEYLP